MPFAGRTDLEIALDLFETAGMEHCERLLEDFERRWPRRWPCGRIRFASRGARCPERTRRLRRLSGEPDVVQSLLTGNIEPNAKVKLSAFGLDRTWTSRSAPTARTTAAGASW